MSSTSSPFSVWTSKASPVLAAAAAAPRTGSCGLPRTVDSEAILMKPERNRLRSFARLLKAVSFLIHKVLCRLLGGCSPEPVVHWVVSTSMESCAAYDPDAAVSGEVRQSGDIATATSRLTIQNGGAPLAPEFLQLGKDRPVAVQNRAPGRGTLNDVDPEGVVRIGYAQLLRVHGTKYRHHLWRALAQSRHLRAPG